MSFGHRYTAGVALRALADATERTVKIRQRS
jgi:hypothetical protein